MLRAFVRPLVSTTFIRSYMLDSARGPVASGIAEKLRDAFAPSHLEVMNESSGHNVPPGSETHFKVVVVSDVWDGLKLIQRHRKVNAVRASQRVIDMHYYAHSFPLVCLSSM